MNKRENIKAVINGKITDNIPYFVEPTKSGKKKLAAYYSVAEDSLEDLIGNHI